MWGNIKKNILKRKEKTKSLIDYFFLRNNNSLYNSKESPKMTRKNDDDFIFE